MYKNVYGPREWMYVKSLPQLFINKMGGLTDMALDRLDNELLKRGVIQSKPGQKHREPIQQQEL